MTLAARRTEAQLDRVFAVLTDPTRRAILTRLDAEDCLTMSALARPFDITLPALMKHLKVLAEAGLITRTKHGRSVDVRLSPGPLRTAADWLQRYERFWAPALDRLVALAETKEHKARAAQSKGRNP
jgi:DNA-binding transcriptional ArsR family regulator